VKELLKSSKNNEKVEENRNFGIKSNDLVKMEKIVEN